MINWPKLLTAVVGGTLLAAALAGLAYQTSSLRGPAMTLAATAVRAPEFPPGLEWLNTDHPLRLADLRGKIVLLDFWTYCCINCMHVIPDLKRLEAQFPNELVVVGVHSAKFLEEGQTDNIRQAILRYGVHHPVVNDSDLQVWQAYGIHSWPTLVLIDPDGEIAGEIAGEGVYEPVSVAVARLIKEFDAKGRLDKKPLVLRPERPPESFLQFPSKVLADETGGRLFIADSGHNRIVVTPLTGGEVRAVIGSGRQGLRDGPWTEAEFNHPQGMALSGSILYVADTENHAIRRIDLEARTVTTLAGTGRQARQFNVAGPGRSTPLDSPWDLALVGRALYIAMAGFHQLWRMDLATGTVAPFAGTGAEARLDGVLRSAALAQPSGLATDGAHLYFADSEDSSIRQADLDPKGRVSTIVGGDLFDFGDRDGKGLAVRLQHPLGVAWHDGKLYVADTYNNKIKVVDPADQSCRSLLGTGKPGLGDGAAPAFYEPGGLAFAGGKLYVADTNNHAIRVADLATGRVETLRIGKTPEPAARAAPAFSGETVHLPPQTVGPGPVTLDVAVTLPTGYKPTADAPTAVIVRSSNAAVLSAGGKAEQGTSVAAFPFHTALAAAAGRTDLAVELTIYYCRADKESVCLLKDVQLVVPVSVDATAKGDRIPLSYTVPPPGK